MCIICTGEIYKQNLNILTLLDVSSCPNLTSEKLQEILIQCKNLETLWCNDCTSLTSLDLRNNIEIKYKSIHYSSKCPWISQNEGFSSNLQRLIKLQRWCRRILLIKYLKSKQFIEWIYNPSNIGGRLYKKWLFKNLKQ